MLAAIADSLPVAPFAHDAITHWSLAEGNESA